jgi:hypothetical protein
LLYAIAFGLGICAARFDFRCCLFERSGQLLQDGDGCVQLVYELATPTTVQLTATEIKALSGINNVWADSGDIEVEYSTISEGGAEYLMNNLIPNTYISNRSPGGEVAYNDWSSTPYIPVKEGEIIKMALYNDDNYGAWYRGTSGTESDYVSRFTPPEKGYQEMVVPQGATYFRYSNATRYMNMTMIWRDL